MLAQIQQSQPLSAWTFFFFPQRQDRLKHKEESTGNQNPQGGPRHGQGKTTCPALFSSSDLVPGKSWSGVRGPLSSDPAHAEGRREGPCVYLLWRDFMEQLLKMALQNCLFCGVLSRFSVWGGFTILNAHVSREIITSSDPSSVNHGSPHPSYFLKQLKITG